MIIYYVRLYILCKNSRLIAMPISSLLKEINCTSDARRGFVDAVIEQNLLRLRRTPSCVQLCCETVAEIYVTKKFRSTYLGAGFTPQIQLGREEPSKIRDCEQIRRYVRGGVRASSCKEWCSKSLQVP